MGIPTPTLSINLPCRTPSLLSAVLVGASLGVSLGSNSWSSGCTAGEVCLDHQVEEAEFGELDALRLELLQRRTSIAGTAPDEEQGPGRTGSVPSAVSGTSELQEAAAGDCSGYGCGDDYVRGRSCQCNHLCSRYGNCCSDYYPRCVWNSTTPPTHAGLPYGHPSSSVTYPEYPGFTLWLVEEFDTPLDLDHDKIWTWSDGGLGQVRFVKEAIKFREGKMILEASLSRGDQGQRCSKAEMGDVPHKKLQSGEIRTKYQMFRYGRYEVRMKAPLVQPWNAWINGNYVSTMFVFRQPKYKHWREIDLEVTGDNHHILFTNVISGDDVSGWSRSIQRSENNHIPGGNTRTNFHTYAFEWLPDSIKWFVDGKQVRHYGGGSVNIPDMSTKILMNFWIFDPDWGFGGREGWNNHYPMHNEYDWFRFYKWDGDPSYPCENTTDSCLTDLDKWLAGNNPCDGLDGSGSVRDFHACAVDDSRCG